MASANRMSRSVQNIRPGSGAMFDRIARRYDAMNRLVSLGLDRFWRRRLVDALEIKGLSKVLDVATGTADVAISIAERHREARVQGIDPSAGMLEVGERKVKTLHLNSRVKLIVGDALALPFAARMFDACCISFGIRNVPDRMQGLREMVRVTRSGGRVAILELGEPKGSLLSPMARFHVHYVVPWLGALFAGKSEYNYLQTSIAMFPEPSEFIDMMHEAGLTAVRVERFAFGAANLFVGRVP